MRRSPALVLITALPALSYGQAPTPTPAQAPAPVTQPADDMLRSGTDRRPPLQPVLIDPPVNRATINPVDPRYRPPTLKREGSFLVNRTGTLAPAADGKSVRITLDPDNGLPPEPPLTVQPNLALMLAEDQSRLGGRNLRFRVTGPVQEYLGRNYLLLQKITVVNNAADPAPPPPTTTPTSMPTSMPADTATQPADANDVLDAMLKPDANKPAPIAAAAGDAPVDQATLTPVAPGVRTGVLRREGTPVINRTGRVTRRPDGTLELHYVADSGRALQDPPVTLLPNLALMLMQDQVRLGGRDTQFRVSGTVTEYKGRNYLLLSKFMVVNDG